MQYVTGLKIRKQIKHVIPLLILLGFLSAGNIFSQDNSNRTITAQFGNENLRDVLRHLEDHFDVQFSYLDQLVENKIISASIKTNSLPEALKIILRGTALSFRMFGSKNIVLYRIQPEVTFSIEGRITLEGSDIGIPFANITIPSLGTGDAADSTGYFKIEKLARDTYDLKVEVIGYRTQSGTIVLDKNITVNFELEIQVIELGAIEITPGIIEISSEEPSTFVLSKSEILSSPNIFNDVFRSIRIFPGVASSEISVKPRIKGGHPDETAIILDNMILYEPFHTEDLDGVFGLINTDIVRNIKIVTGGFSAKYPDKMSGIVEVKTVNQVKDHAFLFTLDFLNASVFFNRKINKKINYFFGARRGLIDLLIDGREFFPIYIDLWRRNTDYEIDFINRVKPSYFDIWSKIDYNISPNSNLSFNILAAGDKFEYIEEFATTKGEYFVSSRKNFYSWINWHWLPGKNVYSTTTFGFQNLRKDAEFFLEQSQADNNKDNKNINILSLKHGTIWKASDRHSLQLGLEYQQFHSDYFYSETRLDRINTTANLAIIDTIFVDSDFSGSTLSGYIQDTWKLSNKFDFLLGLRISNQSFSDAPQFAPRSAIKYNFNKAFVAKLAYGWYYQPDNFYQLRTYQGQERPDPKPEKSIHYVGELSYSNQQTRLSIEAFYKDYTRLNDDFDFDFVNRYERGFIDLPFNTRSGHSSGFNIFARLGYAKSNLVSLSYSYGINNIVNSMGVRTSRDFDRTHSINFNTIFNFKWNITFSAEWRYNTGDPYTTNEAKIFGDSTLSNSKIYFEAELKNNVRLPPYHTFNIKFDKKWQIGRVDLSTYFNIINLYDRKNISSFDWESNGANSVAINKITRFTLASRTLSSRTISLGINLSF